MKAVQNKDTVNADGNVSGQVDDDKEAADVAPTPTEEISTTSPEDEVAAATKIQASYRGYRTRRELKKDPVVASTEENDVEMVEPAEGESQDETATSADNKPTAAESEEAAPEDMDGATQTATGDKETLSVDPIEEMESTEKNDEMEQEEKEAEETEPKEAQPDELQSDETKQDETQPDEMQPDVALSDETQPDDTQPGVAQSNETQPDNTQPDVAQSDETQPDDTQPDVAQSDETQPGEPMDQPGEEETPAENGEDKAAAATLIQASFRGYKTRKNLKNSAGQEESEGTPNETESAPAENESSSVMDTSAPSDEALNEAATKIQATARGYIDRKRIARSHEAATKIQANFRGYKTRKQLSKSSEEIPTEPETESVSPDA